MYVVFDRRNFEVVEISDRKANLTATNGIVLNVKSPNKSLTATELLSFYKKIKGNKTTVQRLSKNVIKEVSEALENAIPKEIKTSSVEKPVEFVKSMCDKMKDKPRKEVIDACVVAGINFNTAKTQYQKWIKLQTKH